MNIFMKDIKTDDKINKFAFLKNQLPIVIDDVLDTWKGVTL